MAFLGLRERRLRGSPSFLRQVDVHIQQVLAHAARNSEAARTVTGVGGLAGFLKSAVGKLY